MSALFAHAGCKTLMAAYGGFGDFPLHAHSAEWLVRNAHGELKRPAVNSERTAHCADCGRRVWINGGRSLHRIDNPATAWPPALP